MDDHTQEPWTTERDANYAIAFWSDNRNILAEGGEIPLAEREASARRIVACVNACAGIPTEALEAAAREPNDMRLAALSEALDDAMLEAIVRGGT